MTPDFRHTKLISQALLHPHFDFGPGALAVSSRDWTNHLLALGFNNDFVHTLTTNTNINKGIVPIDILYQDKITCQNLASISNSWRTICHKTNGIPPCVGFFTRVILAFQKYTRRYWNTMWILDSTLQQDQTLCEAFRRVLEEAAWAETRTEIMKEWKGGFGFGSCWNQVERLRTFTSELVPVN